MGFGRDVGHRLADAVSEAAAGSLVSPLASRAPVPIGDVLRTTATYLSTTKRNETFGYLASKNPPTREAYFGSLKKELPALAAATAAGSLGAHFGGKMVARNPRLARPAPLLLAGAGAALAGSRLRQHMKDRFGSSA